LSDEFLAEVRDSDKKNLAIEALKKLINDDVRSQSKRNVTQSKAFTERLEAAIARYHANALTNRDEMEASGREALWGAPAAAGHEGRRANSVSGIAPGSNGIAREGRQTGTKKAPLLAGPGNLFPNECPQRARETTPIFCTVGCGVATLLPKTGAAGLGAAWGAHVGSPLAAMTAFDKPIGLLIMAACASNNSICFPQPASRRIVLCR
jgi:Domain of unknown function (DUF3387)